MGLCQRENTHGDALDVIEILSKKLIVVPTYDGQKNVRQRNGKIIIVDPNNKPKSRYSDPPARVDVFVIPSPNSEPMMQNPPAGDLKMDYKQDESDNMDLDAISDIQDSQSQSPKVGESKVIVNVNVVRFFSNSKR